MQTHWLGGAFAMALDASVRITLAAAVIALILVALRVGAIEVRHRAWTAVLFAMLAMPVLPRIVPALALPVTIPAMPGFATRPASPPDQRAVSPPNRSSWPNETIMAALSTENTVARIAPAARPHPDAPRWLWIVLAVYAIGAVFLLTRFGVGLAMMRRIVRSSSPIETMAALESSAVATPLTAGVFIPHIVLPADWRTWPADRLVAVLAHERAHIDRRDPLTGVIASFNRCLFWFHPLAWWIERHLAATAEHICDDVAVRATGDRRRYADVLVETALAVRRAGARLTWQGTGVGGGLLGQRIERVLGAEPPGETSRLVRVSVFALSVATVVLVAACQQQFVMPPPLEEDQEVVKQVADERARQVDYSLVNSLTARDIAALEAAVLQDPINFGARRRLLTFYRQRGEQALGAPATHDAIRHHVLWLIEHHPEHELTFSFGNLLAGSRDSGHDEARALWLAKVEGSQATLGQLQAAALFFRRSDPRLSEQLLIRAVAMEAQGQPPLVGRLMRIRSPRNELASLYAELLADPATDAATIAQMRQTLESSTDVQLLVASGTELKRAQQRQIIRQRQGETHLDLGATGQSYLDRAAILDPQSVTGRLAASGSAQARDWDRAIFLRRDGEPFKKSDAFVEGLSDIERLAALPRLAESFYGYGASADGSRPEQEIARDSWDRAKRYAQDAVALAEKIPATSQHGPSQYHAHLVLSILALRAGDRQESVGHLLQAARLPPSDELARDAPSRIEDSLVAYLLKYGERASIVEFLDRTAKLKTVDRDARLKAIEALTQNRMPAQYQRVLSMDEPPTAAR